MSMEVLDIFAALVWVQVGLGTLGGLVCLALLHYGKGTFIGDCFGRLKHTHLRKWVSQWSIRRLTCWGFKVTYISENIGVACNGSGDGNGPWVKSICITLWYWWSMKKLHFVWAFLFYVLFLAFCCPNEPPVKCGIL